MIREITIALIAFIAVASCAPSSGKRAAMSAILKANKEIDKSDIIYGDIKRHMDRQNALMGKAFRWPNSLMHYTFKDGEFSNGNENRIRQAMKTLSDKTCIRFKEHKYGNAPTDHVEFIDGSGCWSYIGIQGGKQQLSLHTGYCMGIGTTTHEILHALGVDHEQARKDRDKYIKVLWENVEEGQEINFQKEETNSLGVVYDPFSVMQYGNDDWSKNGRDTLEWIADKNLELGGEELSALDLLQLNLYYECEGPETTTTTTKIPTTTTKIPTTTTKIPTTTTKIPTTTTKKPTTTTKEPTTTTNKPTTTTTTKKPSTTTTTEKPTKTTTMTTEKTTSTTPVTGVCGDNTFHCVNAYYYPEYKCQQRFYKMNCKQSCGMCNDGNDELQCGNFKDSPNYKCNEKMMAGHCISKIFRIRYRMKSKCTKTCCMDGTVYTRQH